VLDKDTGEVATRVAMADAEAIDRAIGAAEAAAAPMRELRAYQRQAVLDHCVQRVIVHESLYERFRAELVAAARALKMGDPKDPNTFIGPMISEGEASRLDGWIQSAIRAGATLLCGGKREGTMLEATLLEDVPRGEDVVCQEAFGLQAGIFTRDLYKAHKAWDVFEVGGVVIGDVPSWRVDHMPCGGVKDSGLGREGIRWAIEDMTEVWLMVIRTPSS